jgi:hypothetical protein
MEAFTYSVRSACDIVAAALAQYACDKPGQVPRDGLRALIRFATARSVVCLLRKNPSFHNWMETKHGRTENPI